MSDYFCPQCNEVRRFRSDADYRKDSNRYCPHDGTLLRPKGWAPMKAPSAKNGRNVESAESEVPPPSTQGRKAKLKSVQEGMENLELSVTVLSKRPDQRSQWRAHAMALVTDGSAKIPLNLWRDQVNQINIGDRIVLRHAFAKNRRGVLELSTWEPEIDAQSPRKR